MQNFIKMNNAKPKYIIYINSSILIKSKLIILKIDSKINSAMRNEFKGQLM